jgi:hypothetical protein
LPPSRLGNEVDADTFREMCARISSPTLIVQRTEDQLTPQHHGLALAEAIGPNASIIMIDGFRQCRQPLGPTGDLDRGRRRRVPRRRLPDPSGRGSDQHRHSFGFVVVCVAVIFFRYTRPDAPGPSGSR